MAVQKKPNDKTLAPWPLSLSLFMASIRHFHMLRGWHSDGRRMVVVAS